MAWRWVSSRRCVLEDRHGEAVRAIVVNDSHLAESAGARFSVSGPGHEPSTHAWLDDAKAAAEASLTAEQLALVASASE